MFRVIIWVYGLLYNIYCFTDWTTVVFSCNLSINYKKQQGWFKEGKLWITLPGVPDKMFLSKKSAYHTKEHFSGAPYTLHITGNHSQNVIFYA